MRRLCLAVLCVLLAFGSAEAAKRYAVATGGWNSTSVWSADSAGTPGASYPTSSDTVYFNPGSGSITVTLTTNLSYCSSLIATGFTGTLDLATYELNHSGSQLILASGMTVNGTGSLCGINIKATSGSVAITTAGKDLHKLDIVTSTGVTAQLQDALTATTLLRISSGNFDANDQSVTVASIAANAATACTLSLGTGAWNVTGTSAGLWRAAGSGLKVVGETSTLTFTGTLTAAATCSLGTQTYYDVVFANGGAYSTSIVGKASFHDLKFQPSAKAANQGLTLSDTLTVSDSLIIDGGLGAYRAYIASNTRGTQRVIQANGTVTVDSTDFEDIRGKPATSWDLSAVISGDCGGNDSLTFTTADTMFLRGTSNRSFSTVANWANIVGTDTTAGSGRVPLPQDLAVLDASTGAGTITQDLSRIGALTCTSHAGTLTPSIGATMFGSVVLGTGQTITSAGFVYSLAGRGSYSITSSGKSWGSLGFYVKYGTWTLADAFIASYLYLEKGTLTASGNVTIDRFYSGYTNTRVLNMGSGTWTTNGSSIGWNITATNFTLDAGTSTLQFNDNMIVGDEQRPMGTGLTYYNLVINTTSNSSAVIANNCTFNTVTVNPGKHVKFYRGNTFTAANWVVNGTASSQCRIQSDATSAATLAKSGGGTVTVKCCSLSYITASPTSTFIGENCDTTGGNNTNWTWTSARYAVATGNWSNTATWSLSDGGTAGAAAPTSADDVYMTAASGAVTVTIAEASAAKSVDANGFTGTVSKGSNTLLVYGTVFRLSSGMSWTDAGYVSFRSSGAVSVTSAGKSLGIVYMPGTPYAAQVQLQDDLSANALWKSAGTFDANSHKVTIDSSSGYVQNDAGSLTFYDLDLAPAAPTATQYFKLPTALTVSHDLTINSGATYRHYIYSGTRGTPTTFTVGNSVTISGAGADFEDIVGAGAADWDLSAETGTTGNCGGNDSITFTQGTKQFLRGSGNRSLSTAGNWAVASGADTLAGSGRIPLPQDTAYVDASTGAGTITQDLVRIGALNCTGATGTLTTSTAATVYGSLTLGSGQTLTASTQAYTLSGRGSYTLTSAGKTWAKNFTVDAPGGTWTFGDGFTAGATNSITLTRGTLSGGNQNVSVGSFSGTGTTTRGLTMGSGTWTLTGTSGVTWDLTTTTGLTFAANTSTLKTQATISTWTEIKPGAQTYNNIVCAHSGSVLLKTSCAASAFTLPSGSWGMEPSTTFTVGTFTVTGGSIYGNGGAATLAKSGGGVAEFSRCTLSYITGSPANTFFVRNGTNGGNNTNITWEWPRYLVASANWASTDAWAVTTGGTAGASVPDSNYNVYANAASGSATLTVATAAKARKLNATGFTGTLTGTYGITLHDSSLTLPATMTLSGSVPWTIADTLGTFALTTGGKTLYGLTVASPAAATVQVQDTLRVGAGGITLTKGTLDVQNKDVTAGSVSITGASARVLNLGTGTWTINGNADTLWNASDTTNLTFTKGSGLIKFTGTLTGDRYVRTGKLTYDDVQNISAGDYYVVFKDSSTFDSITVSPGARQAFFAGDKFTAADWILKGTAADSIFLKSTSSTPAKISKTGGGTDTLEYAQVQYLTGDPEFTFYTNNSTDLGGNTYIYFAFWPTVSGTVKMWIYGIDSTGDYRRDSLVIADSTADTSSIAFRAVEQAFLDSSVQSDVLLSGGGVTDRIKYQSRWTPKAHMLFGKYDNPVLQKVIYSNYGSNAITFHLRVYRDVDGVLAYDREYEVRCPAYLAAGSDPVEFDFGPEGMALPPNSAVAVFAKGDHPNAKGSVTLVGKRNAANRSE